jgi:thiol-disulfide isomerase/thioredoxin
MGFLNIDKNTNEVLGKKPKTKQLSEYIQKGTPVFILIYMDGCSPCNETRPEWKKLENVLKKYENSEDVVIVDIEQELLDKVKNNNISPMGFPTIKYISKKGKIMKDYDDVDTKDEKRTVGSFVQWIESELNENKKNNHHGGKKINKYKLKSKKMKTKKTKKVRKWSMKYKKSINCKKPKGFSQKQFCKYKK